MIKEVVDQVIIAGLSGLAVGLAPWLYSLARTKQENKSSELDNVQKAVEIWRNLSQELEEKVKLLEEKIRKIEDSFWEKCETCKYRKFYENERDRTKSDKKA